MVIVQLMGGLGNQMFQYAAGRRLAHHLHTELKLDLSHLEGSQQGCTPRSYQLGHLQITASIAAPGEIAKICRLGPARKVRNLLGLGPCLLRESGFHFDPRVLRAPDDTYLAGYWQSERYFADVADILRGEFAVTAPLAGENLELAEQIKATRSISLHVRRGDYVTSEAAGETHGLCGMDYYRSCLAELAKTLPDPHLFVFSDEPEWVREHFSTGLPTTIVSHNGTGQPQEDLRLMSLCRHNIIANSSFSWWGGWLNANPEKSVFAPRLWFRDASYDTRDLIPSSWLQR